MPCLLIVILSSTISVVRAGTVAWVFSTVGRRGEESYPTRIGWWVRIVVVVVVIVIVGLGMVMDIVGVGVHIRGMITIIVELNIIVGLSVAIVRMSIFITVLRMSITIVVLMIVIA